jgi:hypothetical protein
MAPGPNTSDTRLPTTKKYSGDRGYYITTVHNRKPEQPPFPLKTVACQINFYEPYIEGRKKIKCIC